jgi:hypothetical protein
MRESAAGQGQSSNPEENTETLLSEFAYMRETEASKRNIQRLHASLSNRFRNWLEGNRAANVRQENHRVDLTFEWLLERHLAELKICYGADTRHAIREALGQLFEYNHYPPSAEADFWWLVLDAKPSADDRNYIAALKQKYGIPLILAWPSGEGFDAFPDIPFVPATCRE